MSEDAERWTMLEWLGRWWPELAYHRPCSGSIIWMRNTLAKAECAPGDSEEAAAWARNRVWEECPRADWMGYLGSRHRTEDGERRWRGAVMEALRWLKKEAMADRFWKPSMELGQIDDLLRNTLGEDLEVHGENRAFRDGLIQALKIHYNNIPCGAHWANAWISSMIELPGNTSWPFAMWAVHTQVSDIFGKQSDEAIGLADIVRAHIPVLPELKGGDQCP